MRLFAVRNALIRAIAALLLLLAVSTPALAEIACAGESISHLSEAPADAAVTGAAKDAGEHRQDDGAAGSQADHCAFSHGHCVGMSITGVRGDQPRLSTTNYLRTAAGTLVSRPPGTPQRPPSA